MTYPLCMMTSAPKRTPARGGEAAEGRQVQEVEHTNHRQHAAGPAGKHRPDPRATAGVNMAAAGGLDPALLLQQQQQQQQQQMIQNQLMSNNPAVLAMMAQQAPFMTPEGLTMHSVSISLSLSRLNCKEHRFGV